MTPAEYVKGLASDDAKISLSEHRQLSGLDKAAAAEVALVWNSLTVERRRQVLQAAIDLSEDNVELDFNALHKLALRDTDDSIRTLAIDGLWEDEEPSAALLLLDLLQSDPSDEVRAAAATGLARFVYSLEMGSLSASLGQKLRTGLLAIIQSKTEPIDVQRRAIESIAYLTDEKIHALIKQAYASADPKMRASAVFAMGRNCDIGWLDTIVREMKSPEPEIRYEAAKAAGELEEESLVRALVPLLADEDSEVRLAAVNSLGQIGGDTARKALKYATDNGDEQTRQAAREALDELSFADDPLRFAPEK